MKGTSKFFVLLLSVLILLTINLSAQNTQDNRLDTVNATESIVVDTGKSTSYYKIAREMTIKLLEKVNISFDQAGDIEEILISYQEDIAEVKNRGTSRATDQGVTDVDTVDEDRTTTEEDREILGGMDNDENLREIDKETNSEIEDVFTAEQMNTYLFVKEDWWNEVKSRVYGTENELDINNQDQQNTDEQIQDEDQQIPNPNQESPDHDQNPIEDDTSPDTGKTGQQYQTPADSTYR